MNILILILSCLPYLFGLVNSASPPGDVVGGKISAGYQGWFSAVGDGSPPIGDRSMWWHWSGDWSRPPSSKNSGTPTWPDMRDYPKKYNTEWEPLGNGLNATLFSSFDQSTVDIHLQQMAANGIDSISFQRFGGEGKIRDEILFKVLASAEKYGVKFIPMYGVNDLDWWKTEWENVTSQLIKSPAYARQNGKPVVAIWGYGFTYNWANKTVDEALEVINWLRNEKSVYLIGGVPYMWRKTEWGGVRDGYFPTVFSKFDMISPWAIGRTGNIGQADQLYRDVQVWDQKWCDDHGIDFQPNVLPGDMCASQRKEGDFMWRQFFNYKNLGSQGIYLTMFDEYQECNQVAKTAESIDWIPQGSTFKTMDDGGVKCSADYYLRLTKDASKMLKGITAVSETRPTIPWLSDTWVNNFPYLPYFVRQK